MLDGASARKALDDHCKAHLKDKVSAKRRCRQTKGWRQRTHESRQSVDFDSLRDMEAAASLLARGLGSTRDQILGCLRAASGRAMRAGRRRDGTRLLRYIGASELVQRTSLGWSRVGPSRCAGGMVRSRRGMLDGVLRHDGLLEELFDGVSSPLLRTKTYLQQASGISRAPSETTQIGTTQRETETNRQKQRRARTLSLTDSAETTTIEGLPGGCPTLLLLLCCCCCCC